VALLFTFAFGRKVGSGLVAPYVDLTGEAGLEGIFVMLFRDAGLGDGDALL